MEFLAQKKQESTDADPCRGDEVWTRSPRAEERNEDNL
jgi:hypothetical protein